MIQRENLADTKPPARNSSWAFILSGFSRGLPIREKDYLLLPPVALMGQTGF